jgi:hypothetical protein
MNEFAKTRTWIRTFATGTPVAIAASTDQFVPASGPIIPVPSGTGIKIIVGDGNWYTNDLVAANQKLQLLAGDLVAQLFSDSGGNNVTAVVVLASMGNTRSLAANNGGVEGATCVMAREFYIPPNLIGTMGPAIALQFSVFGDVTNTDTVNSHNAVAALDVLWSFEQ